MELIKNVQAKRKKLFYLCGEDYFVHYLEKPLIEKSYYENYITSNVCRIFPGNLRDYSTAYAEKKESLAVYIIQNESVATNTAYTEKDTLISIINGFTTFEAYDLRIVMGAGYYEYAELHDDKWTYKEKVERSDYSFLESFSHQYERLQVICTEEERSAIQAVLAGRGCVQTYKQALDIQGSIQVLRPNTRIKKSAFPVLCIILCALLINGTAVFLRYRMNTQADYYSTQIQMEKKKLQELQSLNDQLSRLDSGSGTQSYTYGPGALLSFLSQAPYPVILTSFSYDKGRFVFRAQVKDSLAFVSYLKSNEQLKNVALSGVQVLPDGLEQCSISGDCDD